MFSLEGNLEQIRLRKIKNITGHLTIVAPSVCLIYAVLFYIIQVPFLFFVGLCIMVLAISSRIAWASGYINYARFSLVILGNAFIFTLCGSLGRAGGANLLYIPLFCAILILYNTRDGLLMIFMLCLSAFGLIILEIFDYSIFTNLMPSEQFTYITRVFSSIVSLAVAISCIYSIQRAGNDAERTIECAREELKKQGQILEYKNKELEQFVYIASHDLKEPIKTVSSLADFLSGDYNDKLDDNAKQSLHFIKLAAERMGQLINGLLEYGRLGINPEAALTDLNEMVRSVINDMGSSVHESGAKIHIDKLPVLNVYPIELRLLFQNLISNAIKFMDPKKVPEIKISALKVNSEWQFAVKDNGIGIDLKNHDKVFEIFQRIHHRSEYEGSGIGLAHAKKIVNLHNGKIWFDSLPGNGSTFYFTLNP